MTDRGVADAADPTESALTSTPLLEFSARRPFRYAQHNVSARGVQTGQGGQSYLTASQSFAERVLLTAPDQFRIVQPRRRLPCLPRARWAETDFAGKRVAFLLPAQALGENAGTFLFLQAFKDRFGPAGMAVFCAQSSADIFHLDPEIEVFTLWLPAARLKRFDHLVDLGQLEGREQVDIWPVDMEAGLLAAFAIPPSGRFPSEARPLPAGPLRIGVLPLASSPLRTLPVAATAALLPLLARDGRVTLCLNRDQQQGVLYQKSLAPGLPAGIAVVDHFASIAALLDAVRGFDYVVCADSGPAHMTKLFGTPGVAVYSSAPGDVLQARFRNLAAWTIPFAGPWCAAPCGLAKLRESAAGDTGCMGSLGLPLAALPRIARGPDPAIVARLLLEAPVPCIASLAADPAPLLAFVQADLERRRAAR